MAFAFLIVMTLIGAFWVALAAAQHFQSWTPLVAAVVCVAVGLVVFVIDHRRFQQLRRGTKRQKNEKT
ncbi:MAG: hypothetical protein HY301_09235 [Verrucomicrobia bacterium]|nr:hypothetical protein [Verrucomicrobiota bacterium]